MHANRNEIHFDWFNKWRLVHWIWRGLTINHIPICFHVFSRSIFDNCTVVYIYTHHRLAPRLNCHCHFKTAECAQLVIWPYSRQKCRKSFQLQTYDGTQCGEKKNVYFVFCSIYSDLLFVSEYRMASIATEQMCAIRKQIFFNDIVQCTCPIANR